MNFHLKKNRILVLSLLIGLASLGIPYKTAEAYYFPYYGRSLGNNLLYSLGYLAYPLAFGRGPYSANPLYSTSSYLRSRTLMSPLYYGRPYYMQNYRDAEPINDPRNRSRPVWLGNLGQDQIAHATWKQNNPIQAPLPNTYQNPPANNVLSDNYDPFALDPATNNTPVPIPQPTTRRRTTAPPVAPPIKKNKSGSAPIADGFVSLVVGQFEGDIQEALKDPATRSWARALGLIDNDGIANRDFPPTRIHLIRQILNDKTLNSVSKLNAIKILLPTSASRATKQGL